MRRKLVIKRSEWARGERVGLSNILLGADGMKCCLGFFALSCGIPKKDIDQKSCPADVISKKWPEWLVKNRGKPLALHLFKGQTDTAISVQLISINDDKSLMWNTREAKLRKLFAEQGVDVTFVP